MKTALYAFEITSPFRFANVVVVESTKDDALNDARAVVHAVLNRNAAFGVSKVKGLKPMAIPEQDKAAWDAPKSCKAAGRQFGWIAESVRWI